MLKPNVSLNSHKLCSHLLLVSNNYQLLATPLNQKERSTRIRKTALPVRRITSTARGSLTPLQTAFTIPYCQSSRADHIYPMHQQNPFGHQVICFYAGSQHRLPDHRISSFYFAVTEMRCKILPRITFQEQSAAFTLP